MQADASVTAKKVVSRVHSSGSRTNGNLTQPISTSSTPSAFMSSQSCKLPRSLSHPQCRTPTPLAALRLVSSSAHWFDCSRCDAEPRVCCTLLHTRKQSYSTQMIAVSVSLCARPEVHLISCRDCISQISVDVSLGSKGGRSPSLTRPRSRQRPAAWEPMDGPTRAPQLGHLASQRCSVVNSVHPPHTPSTTAHLRAHLFDPPPLL